MGIPSLVKNSKSVSSKFTASARKEKHSHGSSFALGDFISMLVSGIQYVGRQICKSLLVLILRLLGSDLTSFLHLVAASALSKAEVSVL